jgi:hypothetical protein
MIDLTVFALRFSFKFCQLWPTDECSEESETESSEESPTSEICIEEMMVTQIYLASALCLRCSPVFRHTAHILTI